MKKNFFSHSIFLVIKLHPEASPIRVNHMGHLNLLIKLLISEFSENNLRAIAISFLMRCHGSTLVLCKKYYLLTLMILGFWM